MKIYLRDRNPEMVKAWQKHFHDLDDVDISCGDIFAGAITDALTSPSNSFSFFDGGIDGYYSLRWPFIQEDFQKHLYKHHYGELVVGNAVILPIVKREVASRDGGILMMLPGPWTHKEGQPDFKWLISAPTMRVPTEIIGTVNAYLAMRATLIAVKEWNAKQPELEDHINSVMIPGLGTAVGKMPYDIAALQMFVAYKQVIHNQPWEVGEDLSYVWSQDKILREGKL